jgi:hypothetical protein
MQEASARFSREYEHADGNEGYGDLLTGADFDERSETSRRAARFVREHDLDLDLDAWLERRPEERTRTRPRQPSGAAADYARGMRTGPRRTVRINGHGAQTALRPTPSELRGPRPDRVAAWGFGFAIFLAVLAAITGGS